jgi:hypothetical protein
VEHILRFQGETKPAFGEVREMDRKMTPPRSIIVPQMVVKVARMAPD